MCTSPLPNQSIAYTILYFCVSAGMIFNTSCTFITIFCTFWHNSRGRNTCVLCWTHSLQGYWQCFSCVILTLLAIHSLYFSQWYTSNLIRPLSVVFMHKRSSPAASSGHHYGSSTQVCLVADHKTKLATLCNFGIVVLWLCHTVTLNNLYLICSTKLMARPLGRVATFGALYLVNNSNNASFFILRRMVDNVLNLDQIL